MHRAGTHPSLEKLGKDIPAGVLELLDVPGLRPEKVLRLHKDLGIASLAELEAAAKRIPAGYVGSVEDAVAAVRFLLSDEARYINGANIQISGAWGL